MSIAHYYQCDGCKEPIGEKVHISMQVTGGRTTGVALPPGHKKGHNNWHVAMDIPGALHHFHNGTCAKKYFDRVLKKYE